MTLIWRHARPRSDFLDGEAFADLRARLGSGVDQQLVEDGASRAMRDRRAPDPRRPVIVTRPKSYV
jgi:hypothetical protein